MILVTALTIGILFGCGVHLMARGDAIKLTAGTLLISNAAILLLVSVALGARRAPLLPIEPTDRVADPLVQAIAITAVVIGLGTTILLLRIAHALEESHETVQMDDLIRAETAEDADENEDDGEGGESR